MNSEIRQVVSLSDLPAARNGQCTKCEARFLYKMPDGSLWIVFHNTALLHECRPVRL